MVEIKLIQNVSRSFDRNPTVCVLMRFIMHTTWLHLRCPIAIQRARLKGDDSHPHISSESLIRFIGQLRPNRLQIEMFFVFVKHSRAIQSN